MEATIFNRSWLRTGGSRVLPPWSLNVGVSLVKKALGSIGVMKCNISIKTIQSFYLFLLELNNDEKRISQKKETSFSLNDNVIP